MTRHPLHKRVASRYLAAASAERDARFRKTAIAAYDHLHRFVKGLSEDKFFRLKRLNIGSPAGGRVSARVFELPLNLEVEGLRVGRIFIALTAKDTRFAGFSKYRGQPIMVLNVLKAEDNPAHLETRLYSVKKTFVHEFVHYLDSLRGLKPRRPESVQTDEEFDRYFTTPEEFNAYFQEGAFEIESYFDRDPDHPLRKLMTPKLRTYSEFEGWAESLFETDWLDSTLRDRTYQRKFKKRLHGLYERLVREYSTPTNPTGVRD